MILGIGALIAVASLQPYFEAQTFNDCTDGEATYRDAFFAELRVIECNK